MTRRPEPKPIRQPNPTPDFWRHQRSELYVRSHGRCEAQVTDECRRRRGDLNVLGMEAHHRKLRSQGGGHGLVNLVALCPGCHLYCHHHPIEAQLRGLICPRYHDPATWGLILPDGRIVALLTEARYEHVMDAPELTDPREAVTP